MAIFLENDSLKEEEIVETSVANLMQEEGIGYLPWRNAGFIFSRMKLLFDSEAYSLCILKGLVTSSGGLTESTLKAS